MARKTKEEKRIEAEIGALFTKHGNGVQFNIMDLGKIMAAGQFAAVGGQDIEASIIGAIKQYRQN